MHRSWINSWINYARGWTQLVQLTKIKLTDWKHLKGTVEILFVPGLNVIRAPNFAGKTSILEALKFCLSGDLPDYKEKKTTPWINASSSLATVEVSFNNQDKEYVLRRSIPRKKSKKDVTVSLYEHFSTDKASVEIASGDDQVQSQLLNFFPWPKNILSKIIFMDERVLWEVAEGGKDVLSSLKSVLLIPQIKQFGDQLKEEQNRAKNIAEELEGRLSRQGESRSDIDHLVVQRTNDLLSLGELLKAFQSNLKTVEFDLNIVEKKQELMRHVKQTREKVDSILKRSGVVSKEEFLTLETTLNAKVGTAQKEEQSANEILNQLKGKEEVYEKMRDLLADSGDETKECPICERALSDDEYLKLKTKVENGLSSTKNGMKDTQEKLKVIHGELNENKEKFDKYRNEKREFDFLSKKIEELQSSIGSEEDLKRRHDELKEKEKSLRKEVEDRTKARSEAEIDIAKLKQASEPDPDLVNRLKDAWHQFHLANIASKAFVETENEYILEILNKISHKIVGTWSRFQSSPISVELGSSKGFGLKIVREEKELNLTDLSGSEKVIFVLLAGFYLSKDVFRFPVQTIDEPLERLDQKNKGTLSKILSELSSDHQIICTAVEEWPDSSANIIDFADVLSAIPASL